jgi:hypothetical protein
MHPFYPAKVRGCREASRLAYFLISATKVIKEALNPPKDVGNAYSMFYTDFYASARRQSKGPAWCVPFGNFFVL